VVVLEYKTKAIRAEQAQLKSPARGLLYTLGLLQRIQTGKRAVVTAIVAGPHMETSLHWEGRAFDLRSKHLSDDDKQAFAQIARFVVGIFGGKVLLESAGTPNEHFHIQV